VVSVAAIRATGATPILVDTDDYYTIDTRQILQSITPKTKAIVAVHLYGQACDLDSLQKICEEKKILLIEDCAQSHGARYEGRRLGSFGKISCFSFYPTKNLGAIGDGGMILTNDKKIAEKARLVREYGWAERYISKIEGTNSRLDSLQAAILRIKLKGLDQMNGQRQEIADSYNRRLFSMGITIPKMREKSTHVYHLYVIESSERDALQQKLHHQGVGTGIHYPMPIHLQPAYFSHVKTSISMKNTERQAKCVLSLPIYPGLRSEQTETVLRILEKNTKMAA
jgi:dTDP-4-amino-4,6-dideoxygalactose transaminase